MSKALKNIIVVLLLVGIFLLGAMFGFSLSENKNYINEKVSENENQVETIETDNTGSIEEVSELREQEKDENGNVIIRDGIKVILITDSKNENAELIKTNLFDKVVSEPFLAKAEIINLDIANDEQKELVMNILNSNGLTKLPVVLLNTKDLNDGGYMSDYTIETIGGNFNLDVGANIEVGTGTISQ